MATHFWMSKKQWEANGLPAAHLDAVWAKKHGVAWKTGGGVVFVDKKTDEVTGFAKVKDKVVTPDQAFKAKYQQLTGVAFGVKPATSHPNPDPSPLADKLVDSYNEQQAAPTPKTTKGEELNLTTVEEVGVTVPGTQKPYRVFLISDDVNLAYRYQGESLAIRAEKFTDEAKKALSEWGLDIKSGERPYASQHLKVKDKKLVAKTLGSLAASVLTGAPKKQLSAKAV